MALASLAPEILLHVFSFLSYPEVYRIRSVSRSWKTMAEKHIFLSIKATQQRIVIKFATKATVELAADSYDPHNRVIEFRPLCTSQTRVPSWNAHHRKMQIHFCQWTPTPLMPYDSLLVQEKAQVLFHLQYNPALERMYELPPWTPSSSCDRHYVGDKGLILSLSYLSHTTPQTTTSYFAYQPAQPALPQIQIHYLRATLAWVLSGLQTTIEPTQIYPHRYSRLTQSLARHGCYKFDPLSEPILSHLVDSEEEDLPQSLLLYVQEHSHECHTRLSRLQHMLEGAGVDARVLWKYTFAKTFVIGNGSLLGEEDIVRRIQDSEEEWRLQKQSLSRRLLPK